MNTILVVMTHDKNKTAKWKETVQNAFVNSENFEETEIIFCAADDEGLSENICDTVIEKYCKNNISMIILENDQKHLAVRLAAYFHISCVSDICSIEIKKESVFCKKNVYNSHLSGKMEISRNIDDVTKYEKPCIIATINTKKCFGYNEEKRIALLCGNAFKTKEQIKKADEVARIIGAQLCASRAVVAASLLPIDKMIGISGKSISPDVCIVLGASGSQAMMSSIEKSKMVISVNSDPQAAVFQESDIGFCCDCFEFLEKLKEMI